MASLATDSEWKTFKMAAMRAQQRVHRAVKYGQLANLRAIPTPCADCGKRSVCYDHRDYGEPLKVDPVCSACNSRRGSAKLNGVEFNLCDYRATRRASTIAYIQGCISRMHRQNFNEIT